MDSIYKKKIDQQVAYFDWCRTDVIEFITSQQVGLSNLENVLEIGCGSGSTGKVLKNKLGIQHYFGIELMNDVAKAAEKNIDHVFCDNFENMIVNNRYYNLDKNKYDLILFLDVLEHLYDPWETLKIVRKWLKPGGKVVCSIPNAGHIYVIKKLLFNRFEYEQRGLLDKTHIRFFTWYTIEKMLKECGYNISSFTTNNDLFVPKINAFNLLTFGKFKKLFVRQYIIMAEKADEVL